MGTWDGIGGARWRFLADFKKEVGVGEIAGNVCGSLFFPWQFFFRA
jgi:hypothetical protein